MIHKILSYIHLITNHSKLLFTYLFRLDQREKLNTNQPNNNLVEEKTMKLIFWNIGNSLTPEKENDIQYLISEKDPDILCLAEGTTGINGCNNLESIMNNQGLQTYYIPTFYSKPVISNQYGWNKFGLKIFIKKGINFQNFTFADQQLEGRIIFLRINDYSVFLVHGMSKADDIPQNFFVVELSNFLKTKQLLFPDKKIIIMGDFNIEPWEKDLLSQKKYIYSAFYSKQFNFFKDDSLNIVFFNPILEYIQKNANTDLIGTFYNSTHISILDYFLLSKYIKKYDIEIINIINGISLFKKKKSKTILINDFDHLPIQIILSI